MKIAIIIILILVLLIGLGAAAFGVYQTYKDQEYADEQIRSIQREKAYGEDYTEDQNEEPKKFKTK